MLYLCTDKIKIIILYRYYLGIKVLVIRLLSLCFD